MIDTVHLLHMDMVSSGQDKGIGHIIIFHTRVNLNNISSLATNIQIPDLRTVHAFWSGPERCRMRSSTGKSKSLIWQQQLKQHKLYRDTTMLGVAFSPEICQR